MSSVVLPSLQLPEPLALVATRLMTQTLAPVKVELGIGSGGPDRQPPIEPVQGAPVQSGVVGRVSEPSCGVPVVTLSNLPAPVAPQQVHPIVVVVVDAVVVVVVTVVVVVATGAVVVVVAAGAVVVVVATGAVVVVVATGA